MKKKFLIISLFLSLTIICLISSVFAYFSLSRKIEGEANTGVFSNLSIDAYFGDVNDIIMICTSRGTYNNTSYEVNDTILYSSYLLLDETDRLSFSHAYICLESKTYLYDHKQNDIITKDSYLNLSNSDKNYFLPQYRCLILGIYNSVSYEVNDVITNTVYNDLSDNDKNNFVLEYYCVSPFIYSVTYSINQVINQGLYDLLGGENMNSFSHAYNCSVAGTFEEVNYSLNQIVNSTVYRVLCATSATVVNNVIRLDGGKNITGEENISGLMVTVSFEAEINCKVRVKIRDQWTLLKTYSTGFIREEAITKPSLNPVNLNSGWEYSLEEGYAYYDYIIPSTEGNIITIPFIEMGSKNYDTRSTYIYSEVCSVTVDFELDVVQANRAESVWGTR